jgi:colanic acid biosynthesis glycosyl transferase WcaI
MRILLITLSFAPDPSPNAFVLTPLVQGLVALGHQVTVLTSLPHRGSGRIYDGYRGRPWRTEISPGLCVHRMWLFVPKRADWRLGAVLRWLSFNLLVTPASLLAGRHDVVMTLSPPITLGVTAWLVSRVRGIPYVYNAQDIYPDVAIEQGLLKPGRVASALGRICRFIYDHAARVTVLTEGFRQNLLAKGAAPEKVQVIPNAVDTELFRPGLHQNPFAEQYGLDGKFVVMYAGNVGDSLGIETLFETMQRLRARDDILFVVVGRGTALARLRAMCDEERLPNIKFLPYQTQEVLPQMYASSDLQLVLQRAGLSRMSAPMKAYVIMSSGRPMLVSMDLDGEPAHLVRRADCGLFVPPESPGLLAEAIEEATRDPARLRVWGENGRQYVVEHLSKEAVVAAYDGLLHGIVP